MDLLKRSNSFRTFYMEVAKQAALLSYSDKRKVGAVIVRDRNIISYGFNGAVNGMPNTCEVWDGKQQKLITLPTTIHAEMNAILKAGNECAGAEMYLTLFPCNECCKLMAQSGIIRVFYCEENNKRNKELYGMAALKI